MLKVQAIPALTDNYIWLIQAVDSKDVLIVDPGEAEPVIKALTEQHLKPIAILNTHYHHDHVDGISPLVEQYQLPVFGPENAFIPKITNTLTAPQKVTIQPDFPDFEILNIPGHTAIHIAYLVNGMLFCGDTLFAGGCGKLLGGTAKQLYQSLQQLKNLPKDTQIYCSHEYTLTNLQFALLVEPNNTAIKTRIEDVKTLVKQNKISLPTTLKLEFETNPFLRCEQPEVIQSAQQFAGTKLTSPVMVFTALRAWRDRFWF
jgi:hydroxyacylglutathione hydrolase